MLEVQRQVMTRVSIPSKREGTCEPQRADSNLDGREVSIPSKREGTCEPFYYRGELDLVDFVSIPSKREGTCELIATTILTLTPVADVSIPSKREGTCELDTSIEERDGMAASFNSLQTGRHM